MAGFIWGAGGAQLTPEQIAAQQKVAQALMEKGSDTSPVQHWSQGANRVLQGLMGGYDARVADEATKANAEENKALIASLLTGGAMPVAGATAPAPMASNPPAMSGGMPQPMAPSVSGKIYRNDEPSPLDPPQGKDRDLAIRTVYGEDPGASASGVANVIRNRAVAGKYGGDTVGGVVLAKNQFEPWSNPAARSRMESLDPNSPTYKRLGGVVDEAYTGTNDPTNGATHFFSPTAQAALGRQVPKWGMGAGQDIGTHRFFGGAQQTETAAADPAAIPPAAAPAQYVAPGTGEVIAPAAPAAKPGINPAAVYAIMANPRASESTQKVAALMLQHQMSQQGVTTIDLGNEVGVMDKTGNIIRRMPKGEPNKGPEFKKIGTDPTTGQDAMGWVNPRDQSTTPYTMPANQNAPASTIPPAPPGVDPKVWRESLSKKAVADATPAQFDDVAKVRHEVTQLPSYKNISQAAPIYKAMFDTAGTNSKASDLNLVYGLGKIMDPTSVVREGEMIMVKNTASLPDWLVGAANGLNGGQALTPETREAILREAHNRVTSYKTMFDQDAGMYRGIAKRNRMDEADVIPDFGEFKPWTRPPAAPGATTPAAKPGAVRRYNPATGKIE